MKVKIRPGANVGRNNHGYFKAEGSICDMVFDTREKDSTSPGIRTKLVAYGYGMSPNRNAYGNGALHVKRDDLIEVIDKVDARKVLHDTLLTLKPQFVKAVDDAIRMFGALPHHSNASEPTPTPTLHNRHRSCAVCLWTCVGDGIRNIGCDGCTDGGAGSNFVCRPKGYAAENDLLSWNQVAAHLLARVVELRGALIDACNEIERDDDGCISSICTSIIRLRRAIKGNEGA